MTNPKVVTLPSSDDRVLLLKLQRQAFQLRNKAKEIADAIQAVESEFLKKIGEFANQLKVSTEEYEFNLDELHFVPKVKKATKVNRPSRRKAEQ